MSYQEYPKWVTVGKLDPVLVQNAEEEAALTGKSQASLEKAAAEAEKPTEDQAADKLEKRLQDELTEKGPAVSEADMVKLTDLAKDIGEAKRGPGRPKKA